MQDLIGKGRDLDVLELKVKDTEKLIKKKIPKYFYSQIEKEKLVEIREMNGIDNKHLIMIKSVIENYMYLII